MEDLSFRSLSRNRQFPNCASEMLKIIERVARQSKPQNSHFLRGLQTHIDEHLFCFIECKGVYSTKLSAVQELHLIDMLCAFFDDRKASSRSSTESGGISSGFELIFCGQSADPALHNARCAILAETVSLAAQLRCLPLLNDVAAWMQKTCLSPSASRLAANPVGVPEDVKQVCNRLIHYYTGSPVRMEESTVNITTPHQHRRLQQQRVLLDLSTLSPGLVPYITASAMKACDWFATPSLSFFEAVIDWMCSDPKLLLKPYREAGKLSGHSSAVFLRSLSEAFSKLFGLCLIYASEEANDLASLYGRLELGLLRLMETAPAFIPLPGSMNCADSPCAFLTPAMVSDTLKRMQRQQQQNLKNMQNGYYALFRALQSAVAYKCYCGTKRDLEQVLSPHFSDYPFLEFVLNQPF